MSEGAVSGYARLDSNAVGSPRFTYTATISATANTGFTVSSILTLGRDDGSKSYGEQVTVSASLSTSSSSSTSVDDSLAGGLIGGSTHRDYYYVVFVPITYTVTFHYNDGSNNSTTQSVVFGDYYNLPSNITRTGYSLLGWYDTSSSAGGTQYTTSSIKGAGVNDLWARWYPNIYLMLLDKTGGLGGPDEIFLQYSTSWCSDASAENKISRIEIPTLKGYAFQGYFTEEGGKGTKIIDGDGVFTEADNRHLRYFTDNDTLYAHWAPIDYNISYNLDNGSYGQYHPTTATFDSFVQISNPTRTGYFFIGWTASNLDTTTAEHGQTRQHQVYGIMAAQEL